MAKASTIQSSFNAGELSPTLDGRVDLAKYGYGCAKMENFYPLVQGGARKRSGTRFVNEVRDSADVTRLIPFEFNTTQAYILEFGNFYMRVYKDGGQVLDSLSAIYEIATPYPSATLDAIQYAQSADVLYLAHPDWNPRKLIRTAHDAWTLSIIAFNHVPFEPTNLDVAVKIRCSDTTGEGRTLTSASADETCDTNTNTTVTMDSTADIHAGMAVSGSGIPTSTTVASVTNSTTFELSAAATVTATNATLTFQEALFTTAMIGGQFKLSELLGSNHGVWEPRSDNTAYGGSLSVGGSVYFENNAYELTEKTTGLVTGTSAPIHDVGIASDGKFKWKFLHSGDGYVTITLVDGKSIDATTDATPVSVSTDDAHGYVTGNSVYISGTGITALDRKYWTVTKTSDTTFTLDTSTAPGFTSSSGFTDGFTATCDVVKRLPESVVGLVADATHRWAHGAWTGKNGYPRTVSFFEDRLWWAGTDNNPQTLWASRTSNYENHQIIDLDESAMIFTLNTDQVNVIEWINAGRKLTIGTAGGEFICSAALEGEALTPGNVSVVRHSTYGSKPKVSPLRVEQVLLFVQRAGRKLREMVYDDAVNSYVAPDMTILTDHITLGGVTRMAFQQEPNRQVWATLATGDLICFTYERAQQVTAWHRHTLGGTDAKVESIAVIPHPDGDQDQLWMVVSRTIGGVTKRFVEFMEPEWLRSNARTSAFFIDSGLSYSGVAVTSVTGLSHLEGQTVSILADGATHPDRVVVSGTVTMDRSATVVHVGLPYSATLQTMRLEGGASDGTAQGKTKRITNVVVRLDQTGGGLRYGPTEVDADMDEFFIRDSYDPMSEAVPLFDGDTDVLPWPSGYEQDGKVTIRHTLPLPCTITAIMPQLNTQDR